MNDIQIKLTFGELDISLQGDGELVYKIFNDIRSNGIGKLENIKTNETSKNISLEKENIEEKSETNKETVANMEKSIIKNRVKRNGTNNYQLLKDLNLNGSGSTIPSLKQFIEEKMPKTNLEKTALFVYYLNVIMQLSELTINHVYTCYKTMNYRIPNNLQQNLTDASSSRYGYINRKNGNYSMTVMGNNFVEFDLPRKE